MPTLCTGYKPSAAKSVDEYAKLDAEDESLARWKASLGIVPGATTSGNGPKVVVKTEEGETRLPRPSECLHAVPLRWLMAWYQRKRGLRRRFAMRRLLTASRTIASIAKTVRESPGRFRRFAFFPCNHP